MGLGMQRTHSVTHTALRDKMPHSGTSFQRQADPGKTGFGKKKKAGMLRVMQAFQESSNGT